jgi:signal transduction histidine kinase
VDHFQVETGPGGTRVLLGKLLPRAAAPLRPADLAGVAEALARTAPESPFEEIHRQNRELLRALDEERRRHDDLTRLNRELEDTNRGVVALYAELDDRVEQLRRANALRAQFTSYLSHEFRTPLDSIIALSGLLLSRVDGELTEEQEKQVGYVRRSARDLLGMVDDLLDTARMEAGQVPLRPRTFTVAELFAALRATLRPLLTSEAVRLVFAEGGQELTLHSDETRVSQILRNFIANALKFTERGEIRVGVGGPTPEGELTFSVSDTGVGISPADQAWIFEDFTRVEGAVQRRVRGTGLGLALSRKLAEMLGGRVGVESTPGVGSTFHLTLPREYAVPQGEPAPGPAAEETMPW